MLPVLPFFFLFISIGVPTAALREQSSRMCLSCGLCRFRFVLCRFFSFPFRSVRSRRALCSDRLRNHPQRSRLQDKRWFVNAQ